MNRILNNKLYIFLSVVFIVFFLQNYMVNTTYPFDTDDWTYIYFSREQPLPLYGSWNPIKVLPEFFQPLFSFIGLHIFTPFFSLINGRPNYIEGIALAYSLFFSGLFTIYFYCIYQLLLTIIKDGALTFIGSVGVFILHFCFFSFHKENAFYLYDLGNVTGLFNYTVPMLFNAILILWCENNYLKTKNILPQKIASIGLLLVFAYFCLFSSIMYNIVGAAYFSSILLLSIFNKQNFSKIGAIRYLKQNWFSILFVMMWFVCAVYEMNGARAENIEELNQYSSMSFSDFSKNLIKLFVFLLPTFTRILLIFSIIGIILNLKFKFNLPLAKTSFKFFITFFIVTLFYLVMGTKTGPVHVLNGFQTGSTFLLLMLIIIAYSLYCKKFKSLLLICAPLVLLISLASALFFQNFRPHNAALSNPKVVFDFDNYVIDTALDAVRNNEKNVVITVPAIWSENGWPINVSYGGGRISGALYNLGITPYKVDITLTSTHDKELYKQFNLFED